MSWRKRTSPAAPNTTTPPVQMYNPNQHQDQWSQPNVWFNQQQQHQQQQQQPNEWEQQDYQDPQANSLYYQNQQQHANEWKQQDFQDPQANSLYYQNQQHSGYYQQNSTYNQPEYNMFSNQQHQQQQQQQQQPTEEDAWNWGWCDEDNSNVNTEAVQQSSIDNAPAAATDAFVKDETWNWNIDESATAASSTSNIVSNEEEPDHALFAKVGDASKHRRNSAKPEDFDSGEKKTIKTEWSTESQESSDDVLQTSESLMSRSSTVSHSPLSGQHTPMEVLLMAPVKQETYENSEIVATAAAANPPPPAKTDVKTEPALPPPPPQNVTPPLENPYKRNSGPNSNHKSISKPLTAAPAVPDRQFPFNLETVPDNSEQPDVPQLAVVSKPTAKAPQPDNNEVAPINERDQYLETGHLSDETIRMVLGQEPPPPGLSRMVLGQNSSRPLQRMVPGESSSPETTSNYIAPPAEPDDDESENEELDRLSASQQLPRSATIGADTPTPPTTGGAGDGGNESHDGGAIEELASSVKDLSVADDAPRATTDSDRERKDSSPHRRRYRWDKRYEENEERDRRDRDRRRYKDNPDQVYKERRYEDEPEDYYDRRRDDSRSYGSLRREKDRRRRDYRDYRERDRYYYGRYDESYDEDLQRSRPTSRSDSMHDSTYSRDNRRPPKHRGADRERERERDSRRPPRQPHADSYSHYMQNYNPYDPYNPYYQQYKYWEHLRQTNPKAYSEFYQQYMLQQGMGKGMPPAYGGGVDDRNSVHSGRSSTNDDLAKERYSQQRQRYYEQSMYYRDHQPRSISGHYGLDDSSVSRPFDYTDSSLNLDTTMSYGGVSEDQQQQRLTPAKFSSAHVCASISGGKMVKILPNYPMDGQPAMVEINRIEDYLPGDDELREFLEFPGPLVKGVTHKKTVIEYCESKIRSIDGGYGSDDACTLMWELLVLLLRQNGRVDGADIAELLMKDKRLDYNRRASSVISNESSVANEAGSQSGSEIKEEIVTNKFREYLLYGSEKEALEWAMKHGLWGHALFLASKLDKRTYANVMMRFANGLPMNDPLQTLYQLLSGRLPASVTSVQDEKWGDWRPHLAMILSNTTQRPELHRKAITTLADTLMSRGSLYAAQFCYLMAEVGFSRYGSDGAKLVLLGSDHTCRPFHSFATNDAIHMTEVYEYARSLSDANFIIPEFQAYKYLLATRLADRGFLETALSYLERVSISIIQNPANSQPTLINRVCELANRLKYNDPVSDEDLVEDLDVDRPDSSWLQDLKLVQNQYSMGLITHESLANLNIGTPDMEQHEQNALQQPEDEWNQHPDVVDQPQYGDQQQQWPPKQQQQQWPPEQQEYVHQQQAVDDQGGFSGQYNQWNHQQHSYSQPEMQGTLQPVDDHQQQQQQHEYWQPAQNEDAPPQISMPNQSNSLPYGDDDYSESTATPQKQASPEKKAAQPSPKKAPVKQASNGWFGGIFKGILRPKNQMKLPDDKNPSIVWDQEQKRWINMDEDGNETVSELKPPPKMSEMMMNGANKAVAQPPKMMPEPVQSQPVSQQPMMMGQHPGLQQAVQQQQPQPTNMFKLQRNRNLKKSYVDVFNPDGKATVPPSIMPPDPYAPPTAQGASMNFFVPAPMGDPNAPMDFLTPATSMMTPATDSQTMSRWSSASSLSREVQYYTQAKSIPPRTSLSLRSRPVVQ